MAGRLAAAAGPGSPVLDGGARPVFVTALTTIVSPATVESPLSGARGAVVHIELLELYRLALCAGGRLALGSWKPVSAPAPAKVT